MKLTQWSKIVTGLILVLAPCFALQGAVIYQSATMGPTGQSGGWVIDDTEFLGSRFYIAQQTQVTAIGGHLVSGYLGGIFGAIVSLSSSADLPNGYPFAGGEVVAYKVFTPNSYSSDYRATLTTPVTLNPGYYALVFGTGYYGASGTAYMPYSGQSDLGTPSYIMWDGFWEMWGDVDPLATRFVVEGTAGTPGYCAGSGGCDEYISRVTVGTIDNTSVCGNYQNFTPLSTTMVRGTGYLITVTNGTPYTEDRCGIWVDWNQDLDFTDAGEEISVTPTMGGGPYTATITPPATATLGNTRMRVRIAYSIAPAPCGDLSYGEVEDYTINVTAAAPSTINISGYVKTAQGVRIKGATVSASTGPNTITDALGKYSLNLPSPFSGTITPAQLDWTFDSRLFFNQSSNLADQNFTGTYNVAYGGGSGTSSSPYLISNAAQLNAIGAKALDWNKYFLVTKDINLSGYDGRQGRPSFNRIGCYLHLMELTPFTGSFDGGNHTISNFTFDSNAGNDGVGIFGYVDSPSGQIKNLKLANVDVNSTSDMGTAGLIGYLYRGTITGCKVLEGTASGMYHVGGLVGWSSAGLLSDCNASNVVSGKRICGILSGQNDGTVTNCSSKGTVNVTDLMGGGLIGSNYGTVSRCYSTANVLSMGGADQMGGLAGLNYGTITNCYAMGSASGLSNTGGLVGLNSNTTGKGIITNCYSTGVSNGGGLVGVNSGGSITGSFWDTQTSGKTSSAGGTGKLTTDMKTQTTFTNALWDFVIETTNGNENYWYIKPADYPHLCWQDGVEYDGGTGTFDDPFLIYTAAQMNKIGLDTNDWNNHFKLMANIDLGQYTGEAFNIIGYGTSMGGGERFSGSFNGNWHTISNFRYNSTSNGDYIGIFGTISGRITNLGLINPQISHTTTTPTSQVGALAGRLEGKMAGCWVQGGSIDGNDYVGGLVGNCFNCYMSNCWSTAQVKGANYVGGLFGDSSWGTETILNCYAQGSVKGKNCVGGLAGYGVGVLEDCYSSGAVTGDSNVGGLIGLTDPCSILMASDLFWDIDTSGRPTSALGQPRTTAEMQTMSTFTDAGWDFAGELENGPDDDWVMPLGGGYPVMWYQLNPWPETPGFAAGSGTKADPYEISTELELRSIGQNPRLMDKYYILTADITLADTNFPIIGSMGYPFIGGFDGQGNTITNLRHKSIQFIQAGMFGDVGPDYIFVLSSQPRVEIKNIRLISPRIETTWGVGAGALIGMAGSGTQVVNCHADDSNISGYEYIGGLVGQITFGNIQRSSAKGYVSSSDWDSGGLVGYSLRSNIEDCYSNGHVSNGYSAAGGLIGANSSSSTVTRCYSSAVVSGPQNTGGLVGSSSSSSCVYRTSFCDATVNPGMQPIGNATDGNVVALPTDQMYMQSTYTNAGWDFIGETANGPNDIWKIDEGQDYPRFAWEQPPPVENITFELDLDKLWMYQNLPGQTKSNITVQINDSTFNDPANNGDYAFYWEIELPDDVTVMPITTAGGETADTSWTFAAPSCNEPGGISDSGQTFKVRLKVVGSDSGNFGIAEKEFAIALLGDVDNSGSVNLADRQYINTFWRTGSGNFTLKDYDLNCDGMVNLYDRQTANSIWRGLYGSNAVGSPCPLRN